VGCAGEVDGDLFPLMMDSVFAQLVIEDVNGDGKLGTATKA